MKTIRACSHGKNKGLKVFLLNKTSGCFGILCIFSLTLQYNHSENIALLTYCFCGKADCVENCYLIDYFLSYFF